MKDTVLKVKPEVQWKAAILTCDLNFLSKSLN